MNRWTASIVMCIRGIDRRSINRSDLISHRHEQPTWLIERHTVHTGQADRHAHFQHAYSHQPPIDLPTTCGLDNKGNWDPCQATITLFNEPNFELLSDTLNRSSPSRPVQQVYSQSPNTVSFHSLSLFISFSPVIHSKLLLRTFRFDYLFPAIK